MSRIQEIFNKQQAKKRELAIRKKDREDQLILNVEDYESTAKKAKDARDKLKKIEFDFDQKHPELAETIEDLAAEVKDLGDSLSSFIMAEILKGNKVEIEVKLKNGKTKKVVPKIKAGV